MNAALPILIIVTLLPVAHLRAQSPEPSRLSMFVDGGIGGGSVGMIGFAAGAGAAYGWGIVSIGTMLLGSTEVSNMYPDPSASEWVIMVGARSKPIADAVDVALLAGIAHTHHVARGVHVRSDTVLLPTGDRRVDSEFERVERTTTGLGLALQVTYVSAPLGAGLHLSYTANGFRPILAAIVQLRLEFALP